MAAGMGRLSVVEVEVFGGGTAVVPWDLRDWLLARLRRVAGAESIVQAFEAVGATRPVSLGERDRVWLAGYLDGIDSAQQLPIGMRQLCDRLRPFAVVSGDLIAK